MSDLPSKMTPSTPVPAGQHLAAISRTKGLPLELVHRRTPVPGPNEILIAVHAVALNPIDYYQRDSGFPPIMHYPAVLGSDVSGVVLAAGSGTPPDAPRVGTRVAAFCPAFFEQGKPDYGAMQARVLVPTENVVPLPDSVGFDAAATLPMSVGTAWAGMYRLGLPCDMTSKVKEEEGILVWGGASSIGCGAVQVAKLMGFKVYVTASEKHHDYLKKLGASRTFDYKDEDVVAKIVEAAKKDGVQLDRGYDAVGQVGPCLDVLKEFMGQGKVGAKLATVKHLSEDGPKVEGIEAVFISSSGDVETRQKFFHFIFMEWLKEKLEKGEYVPSPKVRLIDGGLESLNKALDELKAGVSGVKLVVDV